MEPFYSRPTSTLGRLTIKQIQSLLPRKCSSCGSFRHDKRSCPLITGIGYLELFRGVEIKGTTNLREKYGWGDTGGFVKGYKQSWTLNPLVAAIFALDPKNERLCGVSNLEEYAEQAGVANDWGQTHAIETWIRQNLEEVYIHWLRNPNTKRTQHEDGKVVKEWEEPIVPIIFRGIVKTDKEDLKDIDLGDMNYQGNFILEQEFNTSNDVRITHIGIPNGAFSYPSANLILWAKYEDIPAEIFESASRLMNWIANDDDAEWRNYYDEEKEAWVEEEYYPNSKNCKDEFGEMWWPLKVPVLVQSAVSQEDDALEVTKWDTPAWDYFFEHIPKWETYRLSRFRSVVFALKKRERLEQGIEPYGGKIPLSPEQLGYDIMQFNKLDVKYSGVPELDNPHLEAYKAWVLEKHHEGMMGIVEPRYNAEDELSFGDWADQEMKTHGKDDEFDDWVAHEVDKHGNMNLKEWGEYEERSHTERYGVENEMVNTLPWGWIGGAVVLGLLVPHLSSFLNSGRDK